MQILKPEQSQDQELADDHAEDNTEVVETELQISPVSDVDMPESEDQQKTVDEDPEPKDFSLSDEDVEEEE